MHTLVVDGRNRDASCMSIDGTKAPTGRVSCLIGLDRYGVNLVNASLSRRADV